MAKTQKKEKKDVVSYTLNEALKKAKSSAKTKFDSTIEIHVNLSLNTEKIEQPVRFTTVLPKGTGRAVKVAVFASKNVKSADLNLSESDILKIEKGEIKPKVDFDVLISEPTYMSKLAKVAKILGPAGVMPNPKNGTVTENVEKAVEQVKRGKIDVKMEQTAPVLHTMLGKQSFSIEDLIANFNEFFSTLKQNRPSKAAPNWIKSIFISSTMGPSFKLDLKDRV